MSDAYALLPINALLFPYGRMWLRFFEPRYIRLAKECLLQKKPFVLGAISMPSCVFDALENIKEPEVARDFALASPVEPIGTLVHIIDYELDDQQHLQLLLEGSQRIYIHDHWQGAHAIRYCRGEVFANPPAIATKPDFALFATLVKHAFADMQHDLGYPAALVDDAFWLLGRTVELLSLPLSLQVTLMGLGDPNKALGMLLESMIASRSEHS